DKIELDGNVHADIGASGNFATDDPRFFSAAGATSGHDATDRVIYDTSTGNLWYDADGSGNGAAQLIATLQGAPAISATDIEVINGSRSSETPAEVVQPPLSGNTEIDALIGGFVSWDRMTPADGDIDYSFAVAPGQEAFNDAQQAAAR